MCAVCPLPSHHSNGVHKQDQPIELLYHMLCTILQATLSDKAVGTLLILAALTIFLYYTIWVVVLVSHALAQSGHMTASI